MDFISFSSATRCPTAMDSNVRLLLICPIPWSTDALVNGNNGFVTNKMENAVSHFHKMNNYIEKPTYGKKRDLAMDVAVVIQLE